MQRTLPTLQINPLKDFKPVYVVLLCFFFVVVFFAALAGNNHVLDECYYTYSAVDSVHGVASNIEHPPLVKLLMGASIAVIGDYWLGWRLVSIVSGLVSVAFVYLIGRQFFSERLATFCAGLCCLSLVFVFLGSFGMLDMPCLAFGLTGLYAALKSRYVVGGLLFGLSFLCKELAVLMFLVTLVYLFYLKVSWRKLFVFGGVGVAVAFIGVWIYDLIYMPVAGGFLITNPLDHFWLMVVWQLNLNGVRAPVSSMWFPPLGWVSPFGANALNPLSWLWGKDVAGNLLFSFRCVSSPFVEWLTFPLLAALPVVWWFKKNSAALLCWLWVGASFLPWLLAGFFVRMEANFYIGFAVPFIALGCGCLYSQIKSRRLKYALAITQLVGGIVFFLLYFPIPLFGGLV